MRLRQRLGLRAGIAIVMCSAVLLEIALHRTYTALFGHHIALAVLPFALIGAGVGGLAAHLAPAIARPPKLIAHLGHLATWMGAATLAALLLVLHVRPADVLDAGSAVRLASLGIAATLPFFFAGIIVSATLRHAARDLGRLGFTALGAAALAGPIAVAAIRAGAPRVILMTTALDALAAGAFYLAARWSEAPMPRPRGHVIATALLASTVLIAGDLGAPWIKIPALRWTPLEKTEAQEWTISGLLTVDKAHAGQATIRTDGTNAVQMLEGKVAIPASPEDLPYVRSKDASPVLVLGIGGGRDVRLAQKHAQKEIHAVEPNALVVRAWLRDRYRKWSGELLDKPEVNVVIDDPRGYVRRAPLRFRTIVFPLADTQGAAAVGALAAEGAALLTVEAVRDALDRLTPDGSLLLSRWDGELDRALAVAAGALRAAGIDDPAAHLYACSGGRSTALLVTRASLAARELSLLRAHCRKSKLNEVFAPDQPHGELRRRITTEPAIAAAVAGAEIDLTPTTDDRPTFFSTVPSRLLGASLRRPPALRANAQALFVITSAIALSFAAIFLAVVVPAVTLRPRERERGARLAPLSYFIATIAGLVLAAHAFAVRLPLLLGHPGHALTTVHVALMAFAAGGFLVAARTPAVFAEAAAGYRAQALVVVLALGAVAVGPIVDRGLGLPVAARLAIAIAMLAPVGLLFGALLSLGVKLVAARTPELVPWSIGAGTLAGAFAAAASVLVATHFGGSALLLAAGVATFVAAIAAPAARRA